MITKEKEENLATLSFLEDNLKRINLAISDALPPKNLSKISEAIHYSVLNGGKRIRPQLVLLMAESLDLDCLLYTSPSPRDMRRSRMPSSA